MKAIEKIRNIINYAMIIMFGLNCFDIAKNSIKWAIAESTFTKEFYANTVLSSIIFNIVLIAIWIVVNHRNPLNQKQK